MKTIIAAALVVSASLAGCATHPNHIRPVYIAGDICSDADRERLAVISRQQAATATNDAIGVFLIAIPIGSIIGEDHKDEIARLKGKCGPA